MKKIIILIINIFCFAYMQGQDFTLYSNGGDAIGKLSRYNVLSTKRWLGDKGSSTSGKGFTNTTTYTYKRNDNLIISSNNIPNTGVGDYTLSPIVIVTEGVVTCNTASNGSGCNQTNNSYTYSNTAGTYNDGAVPSLSYKIVNFNWNIEQLVNCSNDADFDLKQHLSYQGSSITFSGKGVFNTTFKPSVAGVGDHIITATRVFDNGTASVSFIIKVKATYNDNIATLGEMWIPTNLSFCKDDASANLINLVRYNQSNSVFSWDGASGNSFDPSAYPLIKTIKYTYTNSNNCTTVHSIPVNVDNSFTVNISSNKTSFCINEVTTLSASPSNGTWTSTSSGLIDNVFNAKNAGVGVKNLKYTVVSGSCSKSANINVNVFALPPTETGGNLEFCKNANGVKTLVRPNTFPLNGGNWSIIGNNIINSKINNTNQTIDITGFANGQYAFKLEYTDNNGCYAADTSILIIQDVLNAPIVSPSFVCQPSQINLQIASPQNNVVYKWYNDTTKTPIFQPGSSFLTSYHNVSTKYWVSVENSFGCESSKREILAEVRTPIKPIVGQDTSICYNSNIITLNGYSPRDGYFDSPNVTQVGTDQWVFNATGLSSGGYQVKYYANINGCPTSATRQINVREPVIVDGGFNVSVCFGSDAIIGANAFPSGGTWSFLNPTLNSQLVKDTNGVTMISAKALEATTTGYPLVYTAIDPSTNCKSTDQILAYVRQLPLAPNVATNSSCGSSFGSLVINNFNSNYTYKWYDDIQQNKILQNNNFDRYQPAIRLDSTTSFYVKAINNSLCESDLIKATYVINPLPYIAVSNSIVCLNNNTYDLSTRVQPSGGVFTNSNNTSTISNIIFPQSLGVGSYVYNYEVQSNLGCKKQLGFQIQIVSSLSGDLLPNDTSFCRSLAPMDLFNFTKLNGGSFSGPGVESNYLDLYDVVDPDNKISITYSKNENGCVFTDQMNITILSIPNNPVIMGKNNGCLGEILEFFTDMGTNLTYAWYSNNYTEAFSLDQNVNVTVGSMDKLSLETKNAIGCPSYQRAFVNVLSNNPVVSFTQSDTTLVSGELISYNYTGSTAQSVLWTFTNGTSSSGNSAKRFVYADTIKKVGMTLKATNNGCSTSIVRDTAYIVTPKPIIVLTKGEQNTFTGNNADSYIMVYPMPVTNQVHFDIINDSNSHSLELYNTLGDLVLKSIITGNNTLDVSNLSNGTYIAKIQGDTFNQTFKIVK